jgi:hypothetical protein
MIVVQRMVRSVGYFIATSALCLPSGRDIEMIVGSTSAYASLVMSVSEAIFATNVRGTVRRRPLAARDADGGAVLATVAGTSRCAEASMSRRYASRRCELITSRFSR